MDGNDMHIKKEPCTCICSHVRGSHNVRISSIYFTSKTVARF